MNDGPNKATSETDKPAAAEQTPEVISDEQLDDVAGGLLSWDGGGGSFGGGDSPVAKPKRRP